MTEHSYVKDLLALFAIIAFAALYVFGCYLMYRVGRKFGIGSFAEYCVPVYNQVLLCRCAGISPWLLLLLVVPLANFGILVYLWGSIARKLGRSFWPYGLGVLLFGVTAAMLAFDESRPALPETTPPIPKAAIYCTAGEFSGSSVPLGVDPIVIGRNPRAAQVVLSAPDISSAHARIWADQQGQIWIQDMASSNGTYYASGKDRGQSPEWLEVKEITALAKGDRFRLGDGTAEFVVS